MPRPSRQRLVVALSVCATLAGATAVTRIPKPLPAASQTQTGQGSKATQSLPAVGQYVGPAEIRYSGRLADELYRVFSGTRSLFTSSGRLQAWYTAIQQADARPALGYGFGTEDHVFIDRVYNFDGSYVENSFLGFYLQLGAIGLASTVVLLLLIGWEGLAEVRYGTGDSAASAYLAVIAAGVTLMLVQSYVYSVGNVATATFWVAGFVAASGSAAARARSLERPGLMREGEVASA